MLSSMCQHVQGLTLMCVCLIQILCPANDLILGPHVTSRLSQLDIGIVCHAWRPCLLNLGFICPLPSVTKSRVFCLGPPYPRRMSRTTFYVRWHRILKSVMLMGGQPCRERQPLWNSHDGLNLTCLDQCHGVRSHGKSSSQSWRKRIVMSYNSLNLAYSGQHPCFGPN